MADDNNSLNSSNLLNYLQKDETSTTCYICKKAYTSPRHLPCCHVFCQSCVKGITIKEDKIQCPRCLQLHPVPEEGNDEWPSSVFCESVMTTAQLFTKDGVICSCCEDNKKATVACFSCGEVLCQSCKDAHRRFKVTRDHNVCPISDLSKVEHIKQFQRRQYDLCKIHRSELNKYYCEDDRMKICNLCVHEDSHRDHVTNSLTAKVKAVTETLTDVISLASAQQDNVTESIKVLEIKAKDVEQTKEKELQAISNASKMLHQIIDNYVNEQKSSVMSQSKNQSAALSNLLKEYKAHQEVREDLLTKANIIEELAICDIVKAGGDIIAPLTELLSPSTLNAEILDDSYPRVKFIGTSLDESSTKDSLNSLLGFVPNSQVNEVSILSCLMPEKLKEGAITAINQVLQMHTHESRDVSCYNIISKQLKEHFDAKFRVRGKFWHCVVGTRNQFGWYVSRHGDNSVSVVFEEMAVDLFVLK